MKKDWRNEKDYQYMDKHTPELWAWEFMRRNTKYIKDWKSTLSAYRDRKKEEIPRIQAVLRNEEKYCFLPSVPGFDKELYINELPERKKQVLTKLLHSFLKEDENYKPDTLFFNGARSKWGLLIDEIIDPDIDKPIFGDPYDTLFYTCGGVFSADNFHILTFTGIEKSNAVAVFDLSKPIQQQYEQLKNDLEEEQKEFLRGGKIPIRKNVNKKEIWKRYTRILDAYKEKVKPKDIASNIFPNTENIYPDFLGNKNVESNYKLAKKLVDEDYLKILQKSVMYKKRK